MLECTVRFGVKYGKSLRDILAATVTKLVHEFGNQAYKVKKLRFITLPVFKRLRMSPPPRSRSLATPS